jgi:hypothetical protein
LAIVFEERVSVLVHSALGARCKADVNDGVYCWRGGVRSEFGITLGVVCSVSHDVVE